MPQGSSAVRPTDGLYLYLLQGRTIRLGYTEDGGNRQLLLIYQSNYRCVPEIQNLSQHSYEKV